jgi:hypothetical protein
MQHHKENPSDITSRPSLTIQSHHSPPSQTNAIHNTQTPSLLDMHTQIKATN